MSKKTLWSAVCLMLVLGMVCGFPNSFGPSANQEVRAADPYTAYLFAYFKGSNESMHYAISDDGQHWTALNGNQPVLSATIGNQSIRDPYILRDQNGTFHLFSTDSWNSRNILVWDSTDLIHWTNERLVPIAPSNANDAWAPQAIYDPDNDEYMVYWSSRINDGNYHRIYKATTTDFQNFSSPSVLFDPGYTVIDGDIVPNPDGTYTMLFKDERDGYKRLHTVTSDQIQGPYANISPAITPYGTEGPATFKVNGENRWITYYDFYYDGYFGASTTTNLVDWTAYDSSEISLPSGIRHGSVIPITEAEKDALLNAWDPNDYERFESHNYPGYFIRHYNYEARIDNNVSPEADSYFRVVPGLADPNLVSLESVNYPGYYLRHYDYQIRLDPDDGTNIFKEDATFEIVPGLADSSKISFESYNYPGYYIRHWDYNLRIEEITDDIGRQDATFQRIQP